MLNEIGYFHSFDSFIQKWNVRTNFLQFNSLLNCVKRILAANNIEEPLQNYENPLQPLSVKLLCSTTKGCRDIYNLLLSSILPTLKSQNKWRIDMNLRDNYGNMIMIILDGSMYMNYLFFLLKIQCFSGFNIE